MNVRQKRRSPAGNTGLDLRTTSCSSNYSSKDVLTSTWLPDNWRDRLPDPATYYARHVAKLGKPNGDGWAACCCPFHGDIQPSASANLLTGGFRCHGCGEHHDLIGFHQHVTGLPFVSAVRDLIGSRA